MKFKLHNFKGEKSQLQTTTYKDDNNPQKQAESLMYCLEDFFKMSNETLRKEIFILDFDTKDKDDWSLEHVEERGQTFV